MSGTKEKFSGYILDNQDSDQEAILKQSKASNFDEELHGAVPAETHSSKKETDLIGDNTTENADEANRPHVKFPPLIKNQGGMAAMSRTIQKEEDNRNKTPLSMIFGRKGAPDSHQDIMSQQ